MELSFVIIEFPDADTAGFWPLDIISIPSFRSRQDMVLTIKATS
jgi:hypothetical protein